MFLNAVSYRVLECTFSNRLGDFCATLFSEAQFFFVNLLISY
jgi:hypothetical protein